MNYSSSSHSKFQPIHFPSLFLFFSSPTFSSFQSSLYLYSTLLTILPLHLLPPCPPAYPCFLFLSLLLDILLHFCPRNIEVSWPPSTTASSGCQSDNGCLMVICLPGLVGACNR